MAKKGRENLSSVALGCRAGLSHSSVCESLLTYLSVFTFLLIRPRDQVLAIKGVALVQIKFKS